MFFKIVMAFFLGASLGFLVGTKKMTKQERQGAECEGKSDNILLKERNGRKNEESGKDCEEI